MEIYKYLPQKIVSAIESSELSDKITEIRIRKNKELAVTVSGQNVYISSLQITEKDIEDIFYRICDNSVNIYDADISNGYITVSDGCRVGIGGEYHYNPAVCRYVLKVLDSLNIRIARRILCFKNQEIIFDNSIDSTLIIGPPHSGKTSLLRLYAKHLSEESRVVLCDERKELNTENLNCDILQGIKKSIAISMATRTMNPQYIICDEIGDKTEAEEILSAVNTGVKFICSAHGESVESIYRRPNIAILLENNIFHKIVIVTQQNSIFFIKDYIDV